MATAKKLPSGNWRCLIYTGNDISGKRQYKSFTANTKKEAEYLATQYLCGKKIEKVETITFEKALDSYIKSRESVLAPSTLREYKRSQKKDYSLIDKKYINEITQQDIQLLINDKAANHSSKTVKNIHGLISAVFKMYRPDMALNTTLPQKQPKNLYIPTDEDIKTIMDYAKCDEEMTIAILLAAFGPLRRSEICGVEDTDIKSNILHVQRAVVMDENKKWVDKLTKSAAGDRYIPLPDFVIGRIKGRKGRLVHLNPNQISDRFIDIQKRSGLPHFRFHDLRHYCASIQHALGVPDAYIMSRGGWNSDTVLKQIYRHALDDRAIEENNKINAHFSQLCNTKCNTNKKDAE